MTEGLLVSNLLLWVALLALGLIVLALTRQIGLLHERLAPVGALANQLGPDVGDPAPQMQLVDLSAQPISIGGRQPGMRTLLFFLSPTCPICSTLLPTLRRVVSAEPSGLRLVLASDGPKEEHLAFRIAKGIEDLPYVLSTDLGIRFAVARLPTAVLIDERGIVRAKGMVNTREHLESLFTAEDLGVASIQDYVERSELERSRSAAGGGS